MNAPLDASESPAAGVIVRRANPADREWISALIGGTAAIDANQNRIEVVEDGADKAVAVWLSPDGEGVPILGAVLGVGPERRDLIYAAVIAACEAALAAGHTRGQATIADQRMVTRLVRDLGLTATPVGRNVKTGKPGHWNIDIDLAEIVAELRRFALAPEGFV